MKQVQIWINTAPGRFKNGYVAGDHLMPALDFGASLDDSDEDILEQAYTALNINPNPPTFGTLATASILQYHLNFPSLSVGDIVEIDGVRYACEPFGWKRLDAKAYLQSCAICKRRRYTFPFGKFRICADCQQGDPGEDLEALYGSEDQDD